MATIYKKSIQLYYKPHDGLELNNPNSNTCDFPPSTGPLTFWYGIGYTGDPGTPANWCPSTHPTNPGEVEFSVPPDAQLGPSCTPIWTLETLAEYDVILYTNQNLTTEASPGKYSTQSFPKLVFNPANNGSQPIVYSYRPPALTNIVGNLRWEHILQAVIGGDPGETEPVLQDRACQIINPILVEFGQVDGEVYVKPSGTVACDPSVSWQLLLNVSYFPTEDVPAGSSLEQIAAAGLPLLDDTGNEIIGYIASSEFPNQTQDVTVIEAVSPSGAYGMNWGEPFVCTQLVAPDETIREFTVKYGTSVEAGLSVNSENNLFCSSENLLRIFYANDSLEYETIEELMRAQEKIYVTSSSIPEEVTPTYWQLVNAPSGAYGINSNRYLIYLTESQPNTSGFSVIGWYNFGVLTTYSLVNQTTPTVYCEIEGLSINQTRTIDLIFSSLESSFCAISSLTQQANTFTYQYLNPFGEYDLTLEEIVSNQIPIYEDSADLGAYYSTENLLAETGFYGNQLGIYYSFNLELVVSGSQWKGRNYVTASIDYVTPFLCEGTPRLINLYTINSVWEILYPNYNFSNEWCYRQKSNLLNYNYSIHPDLLDFDIHQIAKYNVPLNQGLNINAPISESSYSDDVNYYYKWVSNLDGTGGNWVGLNSSGQESQSLISGPIQCDISYQDNLFPTDDYTIIQSQPSSGELLAYYVFTSCVPVNGVYLNYIISGNHTNQVQEGAIYDFVQELGFNSTFFSINSVDLLYGCKKLVGLIYAESPYLAQLEMSQLGYFQGHIQYVTPTTIGIISEGSVFYFNDEESCESCLGSTSNFNEIQIGFFDDGTRIEDLSPRFDLEKNYNLDNVSKPLLRTNPRLTGNVKLIVSSDDLIYLESINATKDLADARYKKYRVSKDSNYSYDVSRFFNDNKTPYDMVYETKRSASDFSVLESYDLQFEDEYQYGVRFNTSKLYDENFRIFAPIKVDTNLPKKFVIYRVTSPKPNGSYTDSSLDKKSRISEMLSNSTIIKVFDLTESSNLGKYVRNHVYNESFNNVPLTFSFEENEQTFYNGIDLVKGGFASKGEYVYDDFVATEKPLIEANDFITDGFKRNRIVSSDILNLEFLFDDEEAKDYSVNRYFGIYVNEIPSGKGKITRVNNGLIKFKDLTSYMYYDNLAGSTFDGNTFAIPSSQMMKDIPVLGYVRCNTHYHNILNGAEWNDETCTLRISQNNDPISQFIGIKESGKSVELVESKGFGYDFLKISVNTLPNNGDSISISRLKNQSYCLQFVNHSPNTNITISIDKPIQQSEIVSTGNNVNEALQNIANAVLLISNNLTSSVVSSNESYFITEIEGDRIFIKERFRSLTDHLLNVVSSSTSNVIKVVENYTHANIFENVIIADDSLPKGRSEGLRFSNLGSLSDVAIAMGSAINTISELSVKNLGNSIYVQYNTAPGYSVNRFGFFINKSNASQFISVENKDTSNSLKVYQEVLNEWDVYYFKGGYSDGRSVLISKNSEGAIVPGDYIITKSKTYNQVIDIVENLDDLSGNYLRVILKIHHDLGSGDFKVFREFEAEIGLFSAYDIYDMNFDFYDTSNSDLKELKYETYQNINYIPANQAIFNALPGEEANELEGIISPDYLLDPNNFFVGLVSEFSPESPSVVNEQRISSEYDRLRENQLKELSTNSRVVPNINKWVLKDAKTVRDQPYYLNSNEAFGKTNFSPDLTVEGRNPAGFTHEWFYIVNKPDYLKHYMLNDTFSYVNYMNGFELTRSMFKSIEHDYFNNFMIGEGFDVRVDPDESQVYNVTLSGGVIFINEEGNSSLNFIVGRTYYFNLSALEDPNLFSVSGNIGSYQYMIIGGVSYGMYTTEINGFVNFEYDGILGGSISVSNEDLNAFEAFVKTNRNIKYSTCRGGNDLSFASTIFKGLKFSFKNRKEFEKEKPFEFLKDSSFNDYKFSILVDFKTNQNNNSIDFEIIKNEKFNFVIMYINVYLDEVYIGNTLNRKLAYLLANQLKLSGESYVGDDVRINGALDLSNIDFNQPGPYIVPGINHFDGTSPDFLTQIAPGEDGTYGLLQIDYQIEDDNGDPIIYYLQIVSVISNNQIIVEGPPVDINGNEIVSVYIPLSLQEIAGYIYVGGGINNHALLLQNLSIKNIANLVNNNSNLIKYTTIKENGEHLSNRFTIEIEDGKEIIRESRLIARPDSEKPKSYSLFKGNIGYNVEEGDSYTSTLIRHSGRYEYDLTPIITFTDIYSHFKVNRNYVKNSFLEEKKFKDRFYKHPTSQSDEISLYGPRRVHKAESYYRKYNRTNVAFNLGFISDDGRHDSNWGMIKNHFYHKVNEDNSAGVTKLSESSEFLPRYPLIGEIAIDKRDINVFRSSWEDDYYRTSLAGGGSIPAPGTFSTLESRSYMSSTVMKLKESYTISSFTFFNAGTLESLDNILKNDSYQANVVFAEDAEKVYIDFYMNDLISDILSLTGIADEINKYVLLAVSFQDKTTLDDDVKSYININLVNLFSVDEVELYVRKTQSEQTNLNPVENLDQVNNGGFSIDANYTLEPHARRPINFRLIYNKSLGYSYIMRPIVKIKQ